MQETVSRTITAGSFVRIFESNGTSFWVRTPASRVFTMTKKVESVVTFTLKTFVFVKTSWSHGAEVVRRRSWRPGQKAHRDPREEDSLHFGVIDRFAQARNYLQRLLLNLPMGCFVIQAVPHITVETYNSVLGLESVIDKRHHVWNISTCASTSGQKKARTFEENRFIGLLL